MKAIELSTPRSKVEFLYNDMTVGEAIKKMSKRRYSMIPVLEKDSNRYLYSISSGDLLYRIIVETKLEDAYALPLSVVSVERLVLAAPADSDPADLADLVANQNYIPLVDAKGVFAGIVTRKAYLYYLINQQQGE